MQRPRDLPQLFGDFDVERLEQFLIFEFGRLFGEVLRQRFVPVPRFPGDAVVALEQLVFARQQHLLDMVLIHDGSRMRPVLNHTPDSTLSGRTVH